MFPNCTQTLSIYNHEEYCHVHQGAAHQEQTVNDLGHNPNKSPYAERQF